VQFKIKWITIEVNGFQKKYWTAYFLSTRQVGPFNKKIINHNFILAKQLFMPFIHLACKVLATLKNQRMKRLLYISVVLVLFMSYTPVYDPTNGFEYEPVIVTRSVLESSVELQQPRDIEDPGRIYVKDGYIFINEKYKGIHVISNADSTNPVNKAFIRIPGCLNMAIKKNVMYADNSADLIAIDISNPENIVIKDRERDVLADPIPPDNSWIPYVFMKEERPKDTYIIDYIEKN